MSLFIALLLPENCRRDLTGQEEKWSALDPDARMTPDEKLHITLAFLGRPQADSAEKIRSVFARLPFSPLHLQAEKTGWFGSLLYASIGSSGALCALAECLRSHLKEEGIGFDAKPFVPHITLARKAAGLKGKELGFRPLDFQADTIALMESRDGKYTILEQKSL